MARMQKLEIVIDENVVRREAEKITSTRFFQDLMIQVAAMTPVRRTNAVV